MNASFYILLATLLATAGNVLAYYQSIHRMIQRENEEHALIQEQSRYFMKLAIYESIPIILMVIGFIRLTEGRTYAFFSLTCVLVIWLLGALFIRSITKRMQEKVTVSPDTAVFLTSFKVLAVSMLITFPILSIVSLTM